MRCAAGSLRELREDRGLGAIDKGDVSQLDTQLRRALDAASLPDGLHLAHDCFTAARNNPSVDDDWLIECAAELIANLVAVARKKIVEADLHERSGGDSKLCGRRGILTARRRLLIGRLAVALFLVLILVWRVLI